MPVTWLVAENDTYFSPAFSQRLVGAFRGSGDKVAFSVLPATGREGHWLAESESGINSASTELERALTLVRPVTSKKQ